MTMVNQPPGNEVPALEVRNLVMQYGAVRALRGVSFKAYRGEVLGLLGDNGAGKSTTVKIIAGSQAPSSGEMLVHGKRVHFQNPEDARDAGIETVFQDLALVENLDVVGNLFLNREEIRRRPPLSWLGWLDKKRMSAQSVDWLSELQIRIPSLGEEVMNLSGGQRQAVSVARAVAWGRDIVLLDEPAAALGVEQSAGVLRLIEQLASNGVCVILVSHNMQHVLDVCQRVVVLRHGEKVADQAVPGMTGQDLVGLITGASINIRGVV
jgi:simple sugar transport system ATP-binding protein